MWDNIFQITIPSEHESSIFLPGSYFHAILCEKQWHSYLTLWYWKLNELRLPASYCLVDVYWDSRDKWFLLHSKRNKIFLVDMVIICINKIALLSFFVNFEHVYLPFSGSFSVHKKKNICAQETREALNYRPSLIFI